MAEEFLDLSNVRAVVQHMSREGMAQHVCSDSTHSRARGGELEGSCNAIGCDLAADRRAVELGFRNLFSEYPPSLFVGQVCS